MLLLFVVEGKITYTRITHTNNTKGVDLRGDCMNGIRLNPFLYLLTNLIN